MKQEIQVVWFSVKDKLPDEDDFVWVKRLSKDVAELAYYSKSEYRIEEFESPYTVGDYEGLHSEFYTDVTHWAELQAPPPDESAPRGIVLV
jgi:hypothetical protein